MGFLSKIGKAKAKFGKWNEEREQKEYDMLKTKSQMADKYLQRDKEKKRLQAKIDEAKKVKFKGSFIGKMSEGLMSASKSFADPKPALKLGKKKGKKRKKSGFDDLFGSETKKRSRSQDDMFDDLF